MCLFETFPQTSRASSSSDINANGSPTTDPAAERLSPTLPTELWLLIISFMEDRRGLFALCGTSNRLRALSLPLAFRTVKLGHDMARTYHQMTQRYRSLQNPQVALVVTDLRVKLWEPKCRGGAPCPGCDTLDVIVGETLLAMANLEALEVTCQLCLVIPNKRHSYIKQLPTRRLRAFNFHCRLCSGGSLDQRESILSSPCLATIHSFSYGPDVRLSVSEPASLSMTNPDTMRGVRDMQFFGTTLDNQILATRPIERLVLRTWLTIAPGKKDRLDQALLQSPGKLTHIIGWSWNLGDQPTFKYLRHFGTITEYDQYMVPQMRNYTHLKHLVSIDARTDAIHKEMKGSTCSELRGMFPALRKILLHGKYCRIWELQGNTWERRDVEDFGVWDIIRGGCDEL